MVPRLIVLIILRCIQTLNHYTEHLKLTQCYMPIVPQFVFKGASLVAQMVKRRPTMWETWVPSLGHEDPLEKEMATHSSPLIWQIPWTQEPGRLRARGHKSRTQLSNFISLFKKRN